MSHIFWPQVWTRELLARSTTQRQVLHNGQPARALALSPLQSAVEYLVSHGGRWRIPTILCNTTITTASQSWVLRVALPIYSEKIFVGCLCSSTAGDYEFTFTATSLADTTGVTWNTPGGISTAPALSSPATDLTWGLGAATIGDPATSGEDYEQITIAAVSTGSSAGTMKLNAIILAPLRVQGEYEIP